MAKKIKAKAPKSVETKDLEPKDVKDVKGGLTVRKAGETPVEYLKMTLTENVVSSFSTS